MDNKNLIFDAEILSFIKDIGFKLKDHSQTDLGTYVFTYEFSTESGIFTLITTISESLIVRYRLYKNDYAPLFDRMSDSEWGRDDINEQFNTIFKSQIREVKINNLING